ncbi:nucleoside-diphosphate kinase [candidate division bacterium WOR-3 4484_18]|uniref:Nucleoside diphosphate kinase n=1 Tax=candidate division WOR-3 bacterium 4484_18 TaxID=2020626 RepID=A0A257LTX9_UNCW3|nr:MAG: nucleoside-diphosphate kinase [candidate division bacterium WOR-3 4484_18]
MNRTLLIIKPDAVRMGVIGEILTQVEREGFKILDLRMVQLTREQAETFYAEHRNKPFFNKLVTFITSGPIVVVLLESIESENGVKKLRTIVGATDPLVSPPGTIRRKWGANITQNAVHASDSPKSAVREIRFFFGDKI